MRKLSNALVLVVFAASCLLAWVILALMLELRNAGRVLPYFTNLCIGVRPLLILMPIAAAAYCFCLCFRKGENASRWIGFLVATMSILLLLVLPVIATSYLLMIDQVRSATGH